MRWVNLTAVNHRRPQAERARSETWPAARIDVRPPIQGIARVIVDPGKDSSIKGETITVNLYVLVLIIGCARTDVAVALWRRIVVGDPDSRATNLALVERDSAMG